MAEPFVVCGEGRAIIRRLPKDILEFVLDVDRYRQADLKIGRVHYVKREGNVGEVRHDGRLLGIKAPAAVLAFTLTPYSRLQFRGIKVPWPLRGFDGFFTCEERQRERSSCTGNASSSARLAVTFSKWDSVGGSGETLL